MSEGEINRHFNGKPWHAPNTKPFRKPTDKPTLWRCWCGRRFRGDATMRLHCERTLHGVVASITA